MIKTVVVTTNGICNSLKSSKEVFKEKLDKWRNNEYDKGLLIKIIGLYFHIKNRDTNSYCSVTYITWRDPKHLELLERMEIGL